MNKEQEELLDEVYDYYWNSNPDAEKTFQYEGHNIETRRMTKDEFVDMVKTDEEYGRRWGLKIKERELSSDERYNLLSESEKKNFIITMRPMMSPDDKYDEVHYTIDNYYEHIPKRAITITYNDQTIESYE